MREAASLMNTGKSTEAALAQADVIRALLRAEFRLRRGAEQDALATAGNLFKSLAQEQRALRIRLADPLVLTVC